MNDKILFFKERISNYEQKIESLISQSNRFSIYRLSIFVAFSVFAIWCLNVKLLTPLIVSIVVFVIVFGLLVKKHNRIKLDNELNQKLLLINQEEINRLQSKFDGIDGGEVYLDAKHPYSEDLDIFGRNSIFQLLNRAGTIKGKRLLASWLINPSDKKQIEKRQQASIELKSQVEWRQKMQAYGKQKTNIKEDLFFKWLTGEQLIISRPIYRVLPYIVMPISFVLIVGFIAQALSLYALVLPFIITGFFLYKIADYSKETYEMTLSGVRILESIKNIVLLIEKVKFDDKYLLEIQAAIVKPHIVASEKIEKLSKIFDWLSLRGNLMYMILNSIFLLDFILLARAEKWRKDYKDEIAGWFDAIAEFEALNSIAAFSFANENYVLPEIADNTFYILGERVGHPLIPAEQRKSNDFSMENKGATCIITGSNMAGKSTFLRTIGVNAVLAFAGAPVCADSFHISIFDIFTSMRTKDNLEENISSFYAELLRLKMLLEKVNEDKPTFYLLDEILKGTNSVDRHRGAESLILQLNNMNTFGLVSTHDLELGNLEKSNKNIRNYNFSSSIVGDEIVFDYKLREGICESTNASQLMAKIGIQINS